MMIYNRRRYIVSFILVMMFSIQLSTELQSAIIHVPADQPTIQAGIDMAIPGDTVLVTDGIYTGEGNRDIDFSGKGIVLKSVNGPEVTIIDCQGSFSDRHRGFTFHSGEDSSAVVDGFTIQGGLASSAGGGIKCDSSSSPKIINNTIIRNFADSGGGGISCHQSNPVISNNIINDNSCRNAGGGGIRCSRSSNPVISNNNVSRNSAHVGGGIFCVFSSNPTISNNIISDNSSFRGGGISCSRNSNPTIINNTISGNSTTSFGSGGGISCLQANPNIINNTIIGNICDRSGGGILCFTASPNISNNIISDNTGGEGGGIFCVDNSNPVISNNTVSGNSADSGGGIFCVLGSNPNINNNTINANSASSGGGIYCWWDSSPSISHNTINGNIALLNGAGLYLKLNSSPPVDNCIFTFNSGSELIWCEDGNSVPALSCCDVFGNESGDWVGCIADQAGINGNFSADPMFCDAATGDFHIEKFSPCAKEHNSCGVLIGAIDIGCDLGFVCGDANGDGQVNYDDLDFLILYYFGFGEAPDPFTVVDLNIDGAVNLGDIVYLANFLNGIGLAPCAGSEPPPRFDRKKKPEQLGMGPEN